MRYSKMKILSTPSGMDSYFYREFLRSEYPCDFIPKNCMVFVGVDMAAGRDTTVRGFQDSDGVIHVQEASYETLK